MEVPSNGKRRPLGGGSDRFAVALKVTRLSNLPVHSKLPSSWKNVSGPGSLLDDGQSVESSRESLLADSGGVSRLCVGPVTELAGQIQAMHNNRSPRKLWGWMARAGG